MGATSRIFSVNLASRAAAAQVGGVDNRPIGVARPMLAATGAPPPEGALTIVGPGDAADVDDPPPLPPPPLPLPDPPPLPDGFASAAIWMTGPMMNRTPLMMNVTPLRKVR